MLLLVRKGRMKAYEDVRRDMKINKGIAAAVAALSIVGLAACGNSNTASGTTDTKADKGLDVIGNNITYDPNHLVNDGKPIQLEYWSWGSKGTDPVYKMIESYTKTYPNVTIKTVNVSWDDYWTKLPLALKAKRSCRFQHPQLLRCVDSSIRSGLRYRHQVSGIRLLHRIRT